MGRSDKRGSMEMSWGCNDWSSFNNWSDKSRLVDKSGCWVLRFDSRFVGLDVSSESESIGDVVDNSESAISISQTIRTNLNSMGIARLTSESSSCRVVFVVSKSIVSEVLEL